jgi:hypothetical protein
MTKLQTLTAYKCSFCYLGRNNPIIDDVRDNIKSGEKPKYNLSDFLSDYKSYTEKMATGKNTDRAIMLDKPPSVTDVSDTVKRMYISPLAGKQGAPVRVYKTSTEKSYDFNADSAALYNHNIFFYESEESIIAIFHRQNGSGCKSVFLETANNAIHNKGLKLDMQLILPLKDALSPKNATATKITLQYCRDKISSDIADNLSNKKKKKTHTLIREIGINLEVPDNNRTRDIFHLFQSGELSKDVAFAQIKNECAAADDSYNDAEVVLKFGTHKKRAQWGDIENLFGTRDITELLKADFAITHDFLISLSKMTDNYFFEINGELP